LVDRLEVSLDREAAQGAAAPAALLQELGGELIEEPRIDLADLLGNC
jgi:hypothetical protein